jgi:hypothetical protein
MGGTETGLAGPGVISAIISLMHKMGDAFGVSTRASSLLRRDGARADDVGAAMRELERKRTDYRDALQPFRDDFRAVNGAPYVI